MLSIIRQQFTGLNLFVKQAWISVRSPVISAGRAWIDFAPASSARSLARILTHKKCCRGCRQITTYRDRTQRQQKTKHPLRRSSSESNQSRSGSSPRLVRVFQRRRNLMPKSKIKTIEMVMSIASSRGVSAQISSTWDAKDYICASSTPLISCSLFDCN